MKGSGTIQFVKKNNELRLRLCLHYVHKKLCVGEVYIYCIHLWQILHFVLESLLYGKYFAVNMCVDCLDADRVSVQAALGWWNNPGGCTGSPCTHYYSVICPPREHSTRNSGAVSPWAQHA